MPEKLEKSENPSFWSTLPGILTAIGGIILAIATLLTVLHSVGLLGIPNQSYTVPDTPNPSIITTPPITPVPDTPTPKTPTPPKTTTPVITYSATIWSWDSRSGWLPVPITMDGISTGYNTPHTFNELSGTHTFTVPGTNTDGNAFREWDTGETSRTISVNSAGTYTARYYVSNTYSATIWSWNSGGWISMPIMMDGISTGFSTPHTFDELSGTHSFTVPDTDNWGNKFTNWSSGETSRTLSVNSAGTYTARYFVK